MTAAGYVEHDVFLGELKLHYQEWGDPQSPTILMVHGFGVSGHMFDEFAQRTKDRYHLIALDQRGHGDSDWAADGDYSREAFVADIEGFRSALSLDDIILMGHSMGGLNAVMYAGQHPEHLRGLILVDVGPEAAKTGVDNIMRFTQGPDELEFDQFVEGAHRFNPRRTRENIEERMRHRLKPSENGKWTWKFDKRFRQPDSGLRIGGSQSNDDMWKMFREVRGPVLIIRGAESDVLTAEVAERAAIEMQNAKLVTVASAGHSVPGDNPDDFTKAVEGFLHDVLEGRPAAASAELPAPLEERVVSAEVVQRRGPGLRTIVAGGIAAGVVIAGIAILIRSFASKPKAEKTPTRRQRLSAAKDQVSHSDAAAQALHAVNSLGESGRRSIESARALLDDVDLEGALASARQAVATGSTTARHAVAAAPAATAPVRKSAKKAAKKAGAARSSLRLAGKGARLLLAPPKGKKQKKAGLLRRLAGI